MLFTLNNFLIGGGNVETERENLWNRTTRDFQKHSMDSDRSINRTRASYIWHGIENVSDRVRNTWFFAVDGTLMKNGILLEIWEAKGKFSLWKFVVFHEKKISGIISGMYNYFSFWNSFGLYWKKKTINMFSTRNKKIQTPTYENFWTRVCSVSI